MTYSPERWRIIGDHFAAVLDLGAVERESYLERSCASDPALRTAVERLLGAHDRAENFLIELDSARLEALVEEIEEPDHLIDSIGPYDITRLLGRGGMGVVYLARDTRLGRAVALKVLAPHLGRDASARDRFVDEARAASAIDHPHIATIYEIGETSDGTLYIGMTYCAGQTLREIIRRGPLPIEDVGRIAVQLADALAAAHQRGIVHRDVKPGNIIVNDEGAARLLDFGIAALAGGNSDGSRTAAGTVAYMSPEQTRGEPPAPTQDVWAYGVTLYEALTGVRPFRPSHVHELPDAIRYGAIRPIRELRPQVPAPLAELVERCLEKLPENRPADGGALLAKLGGVAPVVHTSERHTRARLYAALALLAAAAAAAFAFGGRAGESPAVTGSAIAVLPFSGAADEELERLGRDLAITLSANLDEVGELRTIDALTVLAQPEAARPLMTVRDRTVLARRLGAARILHGTLVRSGEAVRLDATLADVGTGRTIVRASALVATADVVTLTDSVTWALLRHLHGDAREGRVEAGLLMTRSIVALRAFLDGERLVAEGRMRQAPEAYARAFAADSTFWVAYWRYAHTRSYWGEPVPSWIRRAYEDNRTSLPTRDRMMIEARMADSVSQRIEGVRMLTQRHPDYWPGWWGLLEGLIHQGPYLGTTRADAAAAIDQLLLLNPGHAPGWEHRIWLAFADRDTVMSGRALERLAAMDYDRAATDEEGVPVLPFYRFMDRAARQGGAPDPALARATATDLIGYAGAIPHDAFAAGSSSYGLHHAHVELARQMIATEGIPPGIVASARRGLALAWAARGAWSEAVAAMHEYVRHVEGYEPTLHAYRLAAFGEWLGTVPAGTGDQWERSLRSQAARLAPQVKAEMAWWRGVRAAARRDSDGLSAARRELPATDYRSAPLLDRSLAALQFALHGDTARAAAAVVELERYRAQLQLFIRPGDAHPYLTSVNRLGASRWLLAVGDSANAAGMLTWTDALVAYAAHESHVNAVVAGYAYYERAAIAEAQGKSALAAYLYRRFLDRVDLSSASHQTQAQHAARFIAQR